jgi:cobyrinic acid a,c-diamide synthase
VLSDPDIPDVNVDFGFPVCAKKSPTELFLLEKAGRYEILWEVIMGAVVMAGTHSGCGKTTITLGILAALAKKGFKVQSFKAGPDFIDAGLHARVTGVGARNLDLWMCGGDFTRRTFAAHSAWADISVVEGVMGLFDGDNSTSALAAALGLPVVLVVDAFGMAESAGAVVSGFHARRQADSRAERRAEVRAAGQAEGRADSRAEDRADSRADSRINDGSHGFSGISGVIFNRAASDNHFKRLKSSVREIPVLGYLPGEQAWQIAHRHLGLTTNEEDPISDEALEKLSDAVLRHIDLDLLIKIAGGAAAQSGQNGGPDGAAASAPANADVSVRSDRPDPAVRSDQPGPAVRSDRPAPAVRSDRPDPAVRFDRPAPATRFDRPDVFDGSGRPNWPNQAARPAEFTVAVASDKAFCFYYEDNLDMLADQGARIVRFSPLDDTEIPDAHAMYFGGGYPELHAEKLSKNASFLESLLRAARAGMPMYAECGGLMYLSRGIRDFQGRVFPMAGILPFGTVMRNKRSRLGYREVTLKRDCIIGPRGAVLRGHEFHYSDIEDDIRGDIRDDFEVFPGGAGGISGISNPADPADPASPGADTASHTIAPASPAIAPAPSAVEPVWQAAYCVADARGAPLGDEGFVSKNVLASYVHLHFGSYPAAASHIAARAKGVYR